MKPLNKTSSLYVIINEQGKREENIKQIAIDSMINRGANVKIVESYKYSPITFVKDKAINTIPRF